MFPDCFLFGVPVCFRTPPKIPLHMSMKMLLNRLLIDPGVSWFNAHFAVEVLFVVLFSYFMFYLISLFFYVIQTFEGM